MGEDYFEDNDAPCAEDFFTGAKTGSCIEEHLAVNLTAAYQKLDPDTGEVIEEVDSSPVTRVNLGQGLDVHTDGKVVMVASFDEIYALHDTDGTLIKSGTVTHGGFDRDPTTVLFLPDGRFVLFDTNGNAHLYDDEGEHLDSHKTKGLSTRIDAAARHPTKAIVWINAGDDWLVQLSFENDTITEDASVDTATLTSSGFGHQANGMYATDTHIYIGGSNGSYLYDHDLNLIWEQQVQQDILDVWGFVLINGVAIIGDYAYSVLRNPGIIVQRSLSDGSFVKQWEYGVAANYTSAVTRDGRFLVPIDGQVNGENVIYVLDTDTETLDTWTVSSDTDVIAYAYRDLAA